MAAAVVSLLALDAIAECAEYELVPLGLLPGTTVGRAYGINNHGVVVGTSTGPDVEMPWIWTAQEGLRELPLPAGRDQGRAWGVSDTGWVVGASARTAAPGVPADRSRATVWPPGQDPIVLPMPALLRDSGATAVNDRGEVCGWWFDDENIMHGFYWSQQTGTVTIDPFGGTFVNPGGISNTGTVVGVSRIDDGRVARAFGWTLEGGVYDVFPDFALRCYVAKGVNERGAVAGQAETSDGSMVPALWPNGVGEPTLANIPYGWANDISNTGSMAGLFCYTEHCTEAHPFVWDGGQGFQPLPELPGGWGEGNAINDAGWVVGWSREAGGQEVPVLWVPEPGTLALLAFGGMGLIRRRVAR